MNTLHHGPPRLGRPLAVIHQEADTEDCTCPRLPSCGGITDMRVDCPEHGAWAKPEGRFHTHAVQVQRVNPGRHIA